MNTNTKSKNNIFTALKNMFRSGPDIEDVEDIELSADLNDALKNLEKAEKGAEQAIYTETRKSSNNGGFTQKINPRTEEAMRKIYNQEKNRTPEDREIGD